MNYHLIDVTLDRGLGEHATKRQAIADAMLLSDVLGRRVRVDVRQGRGWAPVVMASPGRKRVALDDASISGRLVGY